MAPTIGTRELRADLAAFVRRAAAGQRVVVTIGGRPAAMLGPVVGDPEAIGLESLVAAGLLVPRRRTDTFLPTPPPVHVWTGLRLDRALRDVRG
jgi:prevent-host-death family protein